MERTAPDGPAESVADAVRVLVVDDEPAIADLVGTALRYEGFDVALTDYSIEAPTGFLVLSIANTGTIELHVLFRPA